MSRVTQGKEITTVTVIDPDTQLPVEVSIFKLEGGGMIGVDTSFFNEDQPIWSPLDAATRIILEGDEEAEEVEKLIKQLENDTNMDPSVFDEQVHELAAGEASGINNGGLESQVWFIVNTLGHEQGLKTVREIVKLDQSEDDDEGDAE